MNCYYCERKSSPGGMRISPITADGICHYCGAAVCREHGRKKADAGSPLLCFECMESSEKVVPEAHEALSRSA